MIDKGANINFQDKKGYSALHFIAQNKEKGIAQILLKNGANPNLRDLHGKSPKEMWNIVIGNTIESLLQ